MITEMKVKIINLLAVEDNGLFLDEIVEKLQSDYTNEQIDFVINRMLKAELITTNDEKDIFKLV